MVEKVELTQLNLSNKTLIKYIFSPGRNVSHLDLLKLLFMNIVFLIVGVVVEVEAAEVVVTL
jgi:hypothetical protein